MAGYFGFSMSNNAIDAYARGEKPISYWKKEHIINRIQEAVNDEELILKCNINKLNRIPLKLLKELCLKKSSWHHTSKFYNKTNFYDLSISQLEALTDAELDEALEKHKEREKRKKEETEVEEKWKCAYLEWYGSRKRLKAKEFIEIGIIKGEWFYGCSSGRKKKITAKNFRKIEKIED